MRQQKQQRKKQFVDRAVQGTLLLHLVAHWALFLLAGVAFLFFVEMLIGDPHNAGKNLFYRHGPTLLAVLALAPIFVLDLCKLSNRFVGPVLRLRRGMRDLAEGRAVSPIHFRQGDFWQDLGTDFNQVVECVREAKAEATSLKSNAQNNAQELIPAE